MSKKRVWLFGIFAILCALLLYLSFAVTPADIVVRRSDAAVVQLAAFNGTSQGRFGNTILLSDLNNDSYADLIVGAISKNLSGGEEGAATGWTGQVSIFYSSSDGLHSYTAAQANVTWNGTSPSYFGQKLLAEDFNNDSYLDIVVSSPAKNLSGGTADYIGQISIFYGSPGGFHSGTAADANVTLNGTSPGRFGYSLAANDLNNDGLKDLVVGAYSKNLSGGAADYTGQVYAFYGSSNGLHSCTTADANATFNATSPAMFGYSLLINDFNIDSYNDLAVGARGKNLSLGVFDYTGQVSVFYGSADGLHSYTTDNANVTFNGTFSLDQFGETMAGGDFNNDGFNDIMISAPKASISGIDIGKLAMFYGGHGGLRSSTLDKANLTFNGTSSKGNYLGFAGPIIDDFNNDNYKDIFVGAYQQNLSYGTHDETGQAYIFYGSSEGFHPYEATAANITLNGSMKSYYFGIASAKANSTYGYKIIAIGASWENISGGAADKFGKVYIYSFNFPPALTAIPNQSWNEDTSITLNLSQYFTDVNKDNANFTFTGNSSISVSIDESTNVITLTPNADWHGTEYITFYANDSYNGLVASNNITLSVNNVADCGDSTCDASETCTSCSADCGACPVSLGSSSALAPASSSTFSSVEPDIPLTAKFSEKLPVSEIVFTANEAMDNVKLSVSEASLPASASAPQGEVKEYLKIDAPKLEGKLKEAKIRFAVEKKWLEEKGLKADEVVLQRLKDNAWRELTTTKLKEDSLKAYYAAITPGFSLFAITAKKKEIVQEEQKEDSGEEEIPEEPAQEAPKEPAISEKAEKKSSEWLYLLVIAVLTVITAAFLFGRKQQKRRRKT